MRRWIAIAALAGVAVVGVQAGAQASPGVGGNGAAGNANVACEPLPDDVWQLIAAELGGGRDLVRLSMVDKTCQRAVLSEKLWAPRIPRIENESLLTALGKLNPALKPATDAQLSVVRAKAEPKSHVKCVVYGQNQPMETFCPSLIIGDRFL